jgi:DNA repair exonuclease SbcCD ATPase subunit
MFPFYTIKGIIVTVQIMAECCMYSHVNHGLISTGMLNPLSSSAAEQVPPQEKRENRPQSRRSAKKQKTNQITPVTILQPVTYTPPVIIASREEKSEVRQIRQDKANMEASMANMLLQLAGYYSTLETLEKTRKSLSESLEQAASFNRLATEFQRRNEELQASSMNSSAQQRRDQEQIKILKSEMKYLQTSNLDLRRNNEDLVCQQSDLQRKIGELRGLISGHQSKEVVYEDKIEKLQTAERKARQELEKQIKMLQEAQDNIAALLNSQKMMLSSNQVLQNSVTSLNSTVSVQQYLLNNQRQTGLPNFLAHPIASTPLRAHTLFSPPPASPAQMPLTQVIATVPRSAFSKPIPRLGGAS